MLETRLFIMHFRDSADLILAENAESDAGRQIVNESEEPAHFKAKEFLKKNVSGRDVPGSKLSPGIDRVVSCRFKS